MFVNTDYRVNFKCIYTKLSGIDTCEKGNNILSGHAYRHLFMACSKLEAMVIKIVNQACVKDIMPAV